MKKLFVMLVVLALIGGVFLPTPRPVHAYGSHFNVYLTGGYVIYCPWITYDMQTAHLGCVIDANHTAWIDASSVEHVVWVSGYSWIRP